MSDRFLDKAMEEYQQILACRFRFRNDNGDMATVTSVTDEEAQLLALYRTVGLVNLLKDWGKFELMVKEAKGTKNK